MQVAAGLSEVGNKEFKDYVCEGKSFGQIAADTNLAFARAWRRKRAVQAPVATGAESAKKTKVSTDERAQGARDGEDTSAQTAIEEVVAPMGQTASASDVSFAEAVNRRDMAEVDRAVAAAAGSAAETVAEVAEAASVSEHQEGAKRSCTNSGVEGERVVRRKLNLDKSDDEGSLSDASGVSPDTENIPTVSLQGDIHRNRRLGGKTPSVNTDYSNTRLVTKVELKRLKELKAEQEKRKAKAERSAERSRNSQTPARAHAWRSFRAR